jgi:hypothetical protein
LHKTNKTQNNESNNPWFQMHLEAKLEEKELE